jgi:hypothetical protein
MKDLVTQLRDIESTEPTNMKEVLNLMSVFITALNIGFAFITVENVNAITGVLGLAFLLLRNVPFVFVRLYEVYIFLFQKKDRKTIIMFWRGIAEKQDKETENDKKSDGD